MKLVCVKCGNVVPEGTHWCPNRREGCPPGTLSMVFDAGETFDNLAILERIAVFQSTTLYRAQRGKEAFFLKIAHKGAEELLKQEVRLLSRVEAHPALPVLMSASTVEHRAYNKFAFQGEVKYYSLFRPVEGEFLWRYLRDNPHFFTSQQAAWLIVSLADIVAYLHIKHQSLVLNLSPRNILVRMDKQAVPRPVLMDLGSLSSNGLDQAERLKHSPAPSYLAPEQVKGQACTPATDVYALGTLLYEMLAGQPAVPSQLKTAEEVHASVLAGIRTPVKEWRPELPATMTTLVDRALQPDPHQRQSDVRTLAKGLRNLVGEVPAEIRRVRIDRRIVAVGAFIVLALLLFLTLWLLTQS